MQVKVHDDPDVKGKMAYLLFESDEGPGDELTMEGLRASPIITLNGERFHVVDHDKHGVLYAPMDRSSSLTLVRSR